MLYLYQHFRQLEMERFDGPAGGTNAVLRDELKEAEAEFRAESGSDSEAEPDHISSFPLNARGVDAKLVSFHLESFHVPKKEIFVYREFKHKF